MYNIIFAYIYEFCIIEYIHHKMLNSGIYFDSSAYYMVNGSIECIITVLKDTILCINFLFHFRIKLYKR